MAESEKIVIIQMIMQQTIYRKGARMASDKDQVNPVEQRAARLLELLSQDTSAAQQEAERLIQQCLDERDEDTLERAVDTAPEDELRQSILVAITQAADHLTMTTDAGHPVIAELFAIPVFYGGDQGAPSLPVAFTQPSLAGKLSDSFTAFGLVDPPSRVRIAPGLFTLRDLMDWDAVDLWQYTKQFAATLVSGKTAAVGLPPGLTDADPAPGIGFFDLRFLLGMYLHDPGKGPLWERIRTQPYQGKWQKGVAGQLQRIIPANIGLGLPTPLRDAAPLGWHALNLLTIDNVTIHVLAEPSVSPDTLCVAISRHGDETGPVSHVFLTYFLTDADRTPIAGAVWVIHPQLDDPAHVAEVLQTRLLGMGLRCAQILPGIYTEKDARGAPIPPLNQLATIEIPDREPGDTNE